MVVHITSTAFRVSTTTAVRVHIFFQLRQLSRSLNFEINVATLLWIKDVFKTGDSRTLHIENSASVVFETSHSFNVLGDFFGTVAAENVPHE